jgi:hypothetical protein
MKIIEIIQCLIQCIEDVRIHKNSFFKIFEFFFFCISDSLNDYDQWTEIEDDAKKLHEIVQSQKNQINEIVTLISQTGKKSMLYIYNRFLSFL